MGYGGEEAVMGSQDRGGGLELQRSFSNATGMVGEVVGGILSSRRGGVGWFGSLLVTMDA